MRRLSRPAERRECVDLEGGPVVLVLEVVEDLNRKVMVVGSVGEGLIGGRRGVYERGQSGRDRFAGADGCGGGRRHGEGGISRRGWRTLIA